jgi:hypothetical protein
VHRPVLTAGRSRQGANGADLVTRPLHQRAEDPRTRSSPALSHSDEQQRRRGAGQDICICPAERKTAGRHGPPSRLPRYEQPTYPSPLSACKHRIPPRSASAPRLAGSAPGDAQSVSRRPGRRGAPCSKGIVPSAGTGRALRHEPRSGGWRFLALEAVAAARTTAPCGSSSATSRLRPWRSNRASSAAGAAPSSPLQSREPSRSTEQSNHAIGGSQTLKIAVDDAR